METILMAVDGDKASEYVKEYTKDIFQPDRHQIRVVSVVPETPGYMDEDKEADVAVQFNEASEEYAKKVAEELVEAGFTAKPLVRKGHPGEQLVQACEKHNPRALVMGRRGLETESEMLMGSTSQFVLHNVDCPVTLITA